MDIAFYSDLFEQLCQAKKYEQAVELYEDLGRPFWLAEEVGCYYEFTGRMDLAMYEYEHLINAYMGMGPDFLPLPGGPLCLFTLAKWFQKTDPTKAEKYLRLYLQADEKNPGEPRKITFKAEAQQLLEVLMEKESVTVEKRLKDLEQCPDVVALKGKRVMPEAMLLAFGPETRLGLFWYRPGSPLIHFSPEARSHFHMAHFPEATDVRGLVRGAVFQKGAVNYLLVFKVDFPGGIISGENLASLHHLAEAICRQRIDGIVDEEGRDLLGEEREG